LFFSKLKLVLTKGRDKSQKYNSKVKTLIIVVIASPALLLMITLENKWIF